MKKLVFIALGLLMATSAAMCADVEGASSGVFVNPVYQVNGAPYGVGVGTSTFSWGDADGFGVGKSSLSFTGNAISSAFETPFKIGTLSFFNGTITTNTAANSVDLKVNMALTTPSGINQNYIFGLNLITTPNNTGTADGDADYVIFPSSYGSGSFNVGGVDYYLALTGFENASTGGYYDNGNLVGFHVWEGYRSSADLYGKLTVVPNPTVPEASSLALAAPALLGLLGLRRRK